MHRRELVAGMWFRPRATGWALALLVVAGGVSFLALRGRPHRDGRPFLPASDGEVVETLPRAAGDPRAQEAKRLRRQLSADPRDVAAATRLARLEIEDARTMSDPRHLGYAQAALMPWWADAEPPPAVLVLRATIRQSRHDFPGALADLDEAAAVQPGNAQVWLTRAVVLSVMARYDEAAQSCGALPALASPLVYAVCQAGVRGVTGQAPQAAATLSRALAVVPQEDPTRPWALSVLAEVTGWAGDVVEAERLSRAALALDPDDGYTRAQLADLLLDAGRDTEAAALLQGREQNDGLLLRLALAEAHAGAQSAAAHVKQVGERFAAARLRGDRLHGREEARFELVIHHDAARALALARANWDVQHEPADALILLQAARAARQPAAAAPALAWARATGFQGPAVVALVRALAVPR